MAAHYGVVLDDNDKVVGSACEQCGYTCAPAAPACSVCGRAMTPRSFDPAGTVWARTLVAFAVHGTTGPSEFAYVDLDHGPRVLARTSRPDGSGALSPGDRVRIEIQDGAVGVTSREGVDHD
ncbi:hypothetical protein NGF75_08465 [Dietzia kunjamensis]|uniref:Zn-ribbon domain-containing OB-fold protein n=1 Tax=Dietzia kunjamensis TaxID=322509 RepID=UPI002DB7321B|nr:hypothetical protein [Dietzia kunjamensis]MEB8326019.1 hypothetical protein [Dietzia kunjamensis]